MNFLIACNWKLYFTYDQAVNWVDQYNAHIDELTSSHHNLVLCPSYEAIKTVREKLSSSVYVGAQDCSAYESGGYTGQVSAKSLAQIGCAYSIVGHTETRKLLAQSDELIAQKAKLALANDLFPIIAIGEPLDVYKDQKADEYLKKQLEQILKVLHEQGSAQEVYLAYEPIWAIGTGISADPQYIEHVFNFLKEQISEARLPHTISLLYGGSVNSTNTEELLKIKHLEGFLIGKSSTDFQELKKIVSLVKNRFV